MIYCQFVAYASRYGLKAPSIWSRHEYTF